MVPTQNMQFTYRCHIISVRGFISVCNVYDRVLVYHKMAVLLLFICKLFNDSSTIRKP